MRSFIVCCAAMLSLVACESSTGLSLTEQHALAQHQTQWDHRTFHSYTFVYAEQSLGFRPTVRITVHNDAVVSAIDISTGEPADAAYVWPTIDGLFAIARADMNASGVAVSIHYDPQLGYPTDLSAESHPANPGGGFFATVSNLQALP